MKKYQSKVQMSLIKHEGSFLWTLDQDLKDGINHFVDDYVRMPTKPKFRDKYAVSEDEKIYKYKIYKERLRQYEARKNGIVVNLERDKFWNKLFNDNLKFK